jgi:hypothetical protein
VRVKKIAVFSKTNALLKILWTAWNWTGNVRIIDLNLFFAGQWHLSERKGGWGSQPRRENAALGKEWT